MKPYYLNPNRKKIRGWKRRIKHLNNWGEFIKRPYLNGFDQLGGYTYKRSIIDPFYRLVRRQPPLWFYKLIIEKFMIAYYEWQNVFDDLGVPYDLQIWLFDPNFIQSEILCRRVENKGDVISYARESEENKLFPFAKFANNDTALKQFKWILADDELVIFESELEDEEVTAEELLADGYVKKESEKNGYYYAKKIGDIWVGRHKK